MLQRQQEGRADTDKKAAASVEDKSSPCKSRNSNHGYINLPKSGIDGQPPVVQFAFYRGLEAFLANAQRFS